MLSHVKGEQYIVAGCKSWNRQVFDEILINIPGQWHFIDLREELTTETVKRINPRYIFVLQWSWVVPVEIVRDFECVGFHMTDVPYGRGGSPLQNLILRCHQTTKLTALRLTAQIDAGPVYFKEVLTLDGSAEDIYLRANRLSVCMIERVIREHPQPSPQVGETVTFKRRNPDESLIPVTESLVRLYDFIRMLDAEGYPRAFLEHAGRRYEFSNAVLADGKLTAQVTISAGEQNGP